MYSLGFLGSLGCNSFIYLFSFICFSFVAVHTKFHYSDLSLGIVFYTQCSVAFRDGHGYEISVF